MDYINLMDGLFLQKISLYPSKICKHSCNGHLVVQITGEFNIILELIYGQLQIQNTLITCTDSICIVCSKFLLKIFEF